MSSILRYPKQIGPSDQYIAIPNLQTLAAKACEFISTNPAYVGNSKGFVIPATPQLFGAIENFNSDPALVPVLRDMGKQVFAPMATSLSNGFAGQVTGSGYFEEVQLLLPKPIVYPQGFIGGLNGNAFGVVGSSPDSYTPYLTFYLPKILGGVLGIPVAYYTVTYDLNGGSGVVPQTTAYIAGTTVPLANEHLLTGPNQSFRFYEWIDDSNNVVSSSINVTKNIVIKALWAIRGQPDDGFGASAPAYINTTPGTHDISLPIGNYRIELFGGGAGGNAGKCTVINDYMGFVGARIISHVFSGGGGGGGGSYCLFFMNNISNLSVTIGHGGAGGTSTSGPYPGNTTDISFGNNIQLIGSNGGDTILYNGNSIVATAGGGRSSSDYKKPDDIRNVSPPLNHGGNGGSSSFSSSPLYPINYCSGGGGGGIGGGGVADDGSNIGSVSSIAKVGDGGIGVIYESLGGNGMNAVNAGDQGNGPAGVGNNGAPNATPNDVSFGQGGGGGGCGSNQGPPAGIAPGSAVPTTLMGCGGAGGYGRASYHDAIINPSGSGTKGGDGGIIISTFSNTGTISFVGISLPQGYTLMTPVTFPASISATLRQVINLTPPNVTSTILQIYQVYQTTQTTIQFKGWNTKLDGSGQMYAYNNGTFTSPIQFLGLDITLYGIWAK